MQAERIHSYARLSSARSSSSVEVVGGNETKIAAWPKSGLEKVVYSSNCSNDDSNYSRRHAKEGENVSIYVEEGEGDGGPLAKACGLIAALLWWHAFISTQPLATNAKSHRIQTQAQIMTKKAEKVKKKNKKRKHHKEEEDKGRNDDKESHKLDKKLRKLLHLAPATAQVCHALSSFPTPAKAPPLPRPPPMAPLPPQAPHPTTLNNQVKGVTILTALKPNAQIPSLRADAKELRRRQARAQRFAASSSHSSSLLSSSPSSTFFSQGKRGGTEAKEKYHKRTRPLVGTCMEVEKEYLRSMEEVDPSTVRPPCVLREALQRVKAHWTTNEDYPYACSQLKSIRQDLRMQHMEDAFTMHVYETHARIALEAGDLGEFLVAAARLDDIRRLHASSSLPSSLPSSSSSSAEFLAYRLLHALYLAHPAQIRHLLLQARGEEEIWREPAVVHARAVVSAHGQGNYHRFFRLYSRAPHMSAYLMDFLLLRMRRLALSRVLVAYGPDILPLLYLSQELGFETEAECRQYVVEKEGWVVEREGGGGGRWTVHLRETRMRRKDGGKKEGEGKAEEEEEGEEEREQGERKMKMRKEKIKMMKKKEKKEKKKKKEGCR